MFVGGVSASSSDCPAMFKENLYLSNKLNLRKIYLPLLLTAYHYVSPNGTATHITGTPHHMHVSGRHHDQTASWSGMELMLSSKNVSGWT